MGHLQDLADHATQEELAARAYRAMGNWCDVNSWVGSAKFFRAESSEEMHHCFAFDQYAIDRGAEASVQAQQLIVSAKGDKLIDKFIAALELEKKVFGQLQELSAKSAKAGDYDAVRFLQEYLKIGTTSIRDLQVHVETLHRAGDDAAALMEFDDHIGEK